MLKITRLFNESALNKNNSSKSAFSRNNNSRPVFKRNNGNNKVNRFGVDRNGVEYVKKSGKLKSKKRLSLEIWLSQEKSYQKMRIQLILML